MENWGLIAERMQLCAGTEIPGGKVSDVSSDGMTMRVIKMRKVDFCMHT